MKTSSGRTFAKLHLIIACLLLTFIATNLSAMPVYPGLLNKNQPDGTAIQLKMKGDEYARWFTDDQGYAVVQDSASRTYFYAQKAADGKLEATTFEVGKADPMSAGLQLGITPDLAEAKLEAQKARAAYKSLVKSKAPGSGGVTTVNHLVILAVFNDHYDSKNKTVLSGYGRPRIQYDALFNWDVPNLGIDPYGAAPGGSVRDYWLYNSYGKLNLETTVVGWVKLPENEIYYTDYPNDPPNTRYDEMVADALTRIEADNTLNIDFSTIDALTIIHSAWGAEGGYPPGVHSHAASYANPIWVSQDGVAFSSYNTIPALSGSEPGDTNLIEIGVSVHELGHHVVGLPDLYDTDYSSEGVGNWCVMSGGSWGFSGPAYPSHLSAPMKERAGFIDPIEINIEDINNPDALRTGQHELDYFDELLNTLDNVQDMDDVAPFLRILGRKGWMDEPFLSEYDPSDLDIHDGLLAMLTSVEPIPFSGDLSDPNNMVLALEEADVKSVEAFLKLMDVFGLLDLGVLGYYDPDYQFTVPGFSIEGNDLTYSGAFGYFFEQYLVSKGQVDPTTVLNNWIRNFQYHISTGILEALPDEFILPDNFDAIDPGTENPYPLGNVNFEDQDVLFVIDFLERMQGYGLLELGVLGGDYVPGDPYSFFLSDDFGNVIVDYSGAIAFYLEEYVTAKGTEPVIVSEDPLVYDPSSALDVLAAWQDNFIKYILIENLSSIVPIDPVSFDATIYIDDTPDDDDPNNGNYYPYPLGNIDPSDQDVIDVVIFLNELDRLQVLALPDYKSILGTYEDFDLLIESEDPNIPGLAYSGAVGWFLNEYLEIKGTAPEERTRTPQDVLDDWMDSIDGYADHLSGYSFFTYKLSEIDLFDLMGLLQAHLESINLIPPDFEANPVVVNPWDQDMIDLFTMLVVLDDFALLDLGPLGPYNYKHESEIYGFESAMGYYMDLYYYYKFIAPEEPAEGEDPVFPAQEILDDYLAEFIDFRSELGSYFDNYLIQFYLAYYSGDEDAVKELKKQWKAAIEARRALLESDIIANDQILPDPQTTLGWGAYNIGLTALDSTACYKVYLENDNLSVRTQIANGDDVIPADGIFGVTDVSVGGDVIIDSGNISFGGGSTGTAFFTGGSRAGLPFESGIMLSTGNCHQAIGPNKNPNSSTDNGGGVNADPQLFDGVLTEDMDEDDFDYMIVNDAYVEYTIHKKGLIGSYDNPQYEIAFDAVFASDEYDPTGSQNTAYRDYYAVIIDDEYYWHGQIILDYNPSVAYPPNIPAADGGGAMAASMTGTASNKGFYMPLIFSPGDGGVSRLVKDFYNVQQDGGDEPEISRNMHPHVATPTYLAFNNAKTHSGTPYYKGSFIDTVKGELAPEKGYNVEYEVFTERIHMGFDMHQVRELVDDSEWEEYLNRETHTIRIVIADFENKYSYADRNNKALGDTTIFIEAGSLNNEIMGMYYGNMDNRMREYLLIENRQPVKAFTDSSNSGLEPGFEVGLPYGGLAIWHVDKFASVNNIEGFPGQQSSTGFEWPWNGYHYGVALLQADGNFDLEKGLNRSDAYDLFRAPDPTGQAQSVDDPILSDYPLINDFTVPNTKKYLWGCVAPTYNSISNITPAGNQMSFVFMEDGVYNDDFNRPLSINEFADMSFGNSGVWWPGEATYDYTEWWKYNAAGQAKPFVSNEFPDGLPGGHPRRDPDFIPDKYQIFGSTEFADEEWIPNTYDPFRWIQGPTCSPQDPAGSAYDAFGDSLKTVDLYALWYEFTAEKTGFVTIETCTAGFDTTIAVYRDPQHVIDIQKHIEADTELGCNDDYPTGVPECAYASYLDFYMEEGESYLIRIGGYNTERGPFRMTIEYIDPPVNDEPAGAIELHESVPMEGRTVGATGIDISSGGDNDFCDLWYVFTPSEYDYYSIKVCDGKADLTVGAYLDTEGNLDPLEFTEVTFNDNCADDPRQTCLDCAANFPEDERFNTSDGNDDPQISVLMEPDVTYYIRVAGSQSTFGEYIVEVNRRPVGDDCASAITATDYNILGLLYQGTTASSRPSIAADYPGVVKPGTRSGGDVVVDLFEQSTVTTKKGKGSSQYAVRTNAVVANVLALKKALSVNEKVKVQLDLFDDTTLICTPKKVVRKGDNRFTWIGKVEGMPNSMVIISVIDGSVSGSVFTGAKEYSFGTDGQVVTVSEVGSLPFNNPVVIPDTTGKTFTPMGESKVSLPDGGDVCDVMVVYTPAALDMAGSLEDMETVIDTFIATANEVYNNSEITMELRLVHIALVDYDADATYEDGEDYLEDLTSGAIPEVDDLRDLYGADLVCMLTDLQFDAAPGDPTPGYSGVAYLMPEFSLDSESFCYSVVGMPTSGLIAPLSLTFTHELGHNMGCGHAVEQLVQPGPGVFEYSSGWYIKDAVDPDFGLPQSTIMAYQDKNSDGSEYYIRIPYFSNPNIDLGFGPIGDADTADNARTINETRYAVCNYRRSAALESIEIVGEAVVEENSNVLLSCVARFTGGTVVDITNLCDWTVEDGDGPGIIDAFGLFDPNGQYGTTIVHATYLKDLPGEMVDSHAITVVPAMLRSNCGSNGDIYDVYDVWYKYTPRYDANVTVSLAGSSFDTVLNVFDSCGGNILACNDDLSSYSQASALTMPMEGGKRYLIRISGYGGDTGAYTMKITGGEGDGVDILELLGGEEKIIIDGQTVDMKISAIGGEAPYQNWSIAAKRGEAKDFAELIGGSKYSTLIATAPLPGQGNLEADDAFFDYTLPFENGFPFFGNTYSNIRICTNGFIDLSGSATVMPENTTELFAANTIIAPMWDDLTLEGQENNIELGVASDHVVIKWIAKQVINDNPCAFAVQLFKNGEIQFHYGDSVNENVTPTVGISSGNETIGNIPYAAYSSTFGIDLNNVDSLRYFDPSFDATMLPPGLSHTIGADGIRILGTVDRSLATIDPDLDEYPVRISVKDSGDPIRSIDKVITFKYVGYFGFDMLEVIAQNWLNGGCQADDNWCDQSDLNGDGIVDVNDVGVLGLGWAIPQ